MSETITVTGNVVSDPEQRPLRGDETVTSFRVAASHRRFDAQTNTWVDAYTNFYSVSVFRALGVNAYAALKKGQRVIVTGRLRLKEWDNGTRKGVAAEIDADSVGHDLMFGITTFHPAGRTVERPVAVEAAPPEQASPSPLVEEWAVPQAAGADLTPF